MFPIGDSPNPRGISWVNIILIALNIGVYLLLLPQTTTPVNPEDPRVTAYISAITEASQISPTEEQALRSQLTEYDLTVYEYGSRPASWTWLTMLTSMFLHGGLMHLFGNMLFLWIYGNNIEHRLGRFWYLIAYLATGFAASFGDILLRPDSNVPGVGASGAISGVLGMYILWFPKNKVRLLMLMGGASRVMEVSAVWVLGFYIVVQNIIPAFFSSGGGGGVAHGAHIGGFIAGVALAWVLNIRTKMWPARHADPGAEFDPRQISDSQSALGLGKSLSAEGEARSALAAYERGIEFDPHGPLGVEAHLGAARELAGSLKQPTMAYQHVVAAMEGSPSDWQVDEARGTMAAIRAQVTSVPNRY